MLIKVDAKYLDWVCAVYLSQDEVGIKEILENEDIHTNNQRRLALPSRLIAKVFLFRLIFGGDDYSFANDPLFSPIGNQSFWQKTIQNFLEKYQGLDAWHTRLVEQVVESGSVHIPTGRTWRFEPERKRGELVFPRTKIVNYPVQGLEADIMSIARTSCHRRIKDKKQYVGKVLPVNSVHDELIFDIVPELTEEVCCLIQKVFDDIPSNFFNLFKVEFNLPVRCEIFYGENWKDVKLWGS